MKLYALRSYAPQTRQAGSALIVCLILLTILSLIGLGSASNAVLEEKMSTNSQLKASVFQMTQSEGGAQIGAIEQDLSPMEDALTQQNVALAGVINQAGIAMASELTHVHTGPFVARTADQITSIGSQAMYAELTISSSLGETGAQSQQTFGLSYRLPSAD